MIELLKLLYPLRLAPVSSGADRAVQILCDQLPFHTHEYAAGREHNGWVVPAKWEVDRAEIWKDDRLVYDGKAHPLGVIGYSRSFQGTIDLDTLRQHLFHHPVFPDALVYHCDLYYKVGRENWGFAVPRNVAEALEPGNYQVVLETRHEPGTMKVLDYVLPGDTPQTIILNAHTCHAAQANDDIAGVVVGIEAMKRLGERRGRRYTYRLVLAPEHFGTVFFLADRPAEESARFRYCLFLEMLGNDHRLALQESFTGASRLDRAAYLYLRHHAPDFVSDKFRRIIGNDETVWEAAGFEIPTISLSRFPYPEYHSSRDTHEIISEARLEEAVRAVLGILDVFETDCTMERRFKGLVALSHPRYGLYIDMADPSLRPSISAEQRKWNYLMDCLPRYFDGRTTVLDIAERHELAYSDVFEYVCRFREKGLVKLVPHFPAFDR